VEPVQGVPRCPASAAGAEGRKAPSFWPKRWPLVVPPWRSLPRPISLRIGPGPSTTSLPRSRTRQLGLGIDLEGAAVSSKGVLEQFAAFFCAAARREFSQRGNGEMSENFKYLWPGFRLECISDSILFAGSSTNSRADLGAS